MSEGIQLSNANPVVYQRSEDRLQTATDEDEDVHDPIDEREIFDILFLTLALLEAFISTPMFLLLCCFNGCCGH